MIRAVFDTNVLASLFTADAGSLLDLRHRLRRGDFTLVVTEPILGELSTAWSKPYWRRRISDDERHRYLLVIEQQAEAIEVTVDVRGVASHPEDDHVLAAAVSAEAHILVTGDAGLLELGVFQGVQIVTPRELLDLLPAP